MRGVETVKQGWISSSIPYNSFSEGIIVYFNDEISLDVLVEVHLLTHSSTSMHNMSDKYRSAVYYFDSNDKPIIESIIRKLTLENHTSYITKTLVFVDFKLNSDTYLNYYMKDKQKPFCVTNIDPKLRTIRKRFRQQVKDMF